MELEVEDTEDITSNRLASRQGRSRAAATQEQAQAHAPSTGKNLAFGRCLRTSAAKSRMSASWSAFDWFHTWCVGRSPRK